MSSKDVFEAMESGDLREVREMLIGINLTQEELEKKHAVKISVCHTQIVHFIIFF